MEEADCSYFIYFRPESPDVENRMLCRLLQAGDEALPVNQTGTILGELHICRITRKLILTYPVLFDKIIFILWDDTTELCYELKTERALHNYGGLNFKPGY